MTSHDLCSFLKKAWILSKDLDKDDIQKIATFGNIKIRQDNLKNCFRFKDLKYYEDQKQCLMVESINGSEFTNKDNMFIDILSLLHTNDHIEIYSSDGKLLHETEYSLLLGKVGNLSWSKEKLDNLFKTNETIIIIISDSSKMTDIQHIYYYTKSLTLKKAFTCYSLQDDDNIIHLIDMCS
jgi:hypothetical protein